MAYFNSVTACLLKEHTVLPGVPNSNPHPQPEQGFMPAPNPQHPTSTPLLYGQQPMHNAQATTSNGYVYIPTNYHVYNTSPQGPFTIYDGGQYVYPISPSFGYVDAPIDAGQSTSPTTARRQSRLPNPRHRFECEICHNTFDRVNRLDACHNRHQNRKPYLCTGQCGFSACAVSYGSIDHLKRHLKRSVRGSFS